MLWPSHISSREPKHRKAGRFIGCTEFDSVEVDNEVIILSEKELAISEFVQVKITKAYDYDLERGVVVEHHKQDA